MSSPLASAIAGLASADPSERKTAADTIYRAGRTSADEAVSLWWKDAELAGLLLGPSPVVTIGLAVERATFGRIRVANGQDAEEFELHFPDGILLDVLTTREPGGSGAIARYLAKFGERVQQVEFRCENVDRATAILKEKFDVKPVYSATRPGADGTRVNFFLVPSTAAGKVLIELYEVSAAPQVPIASAR